MNSENKSKTESENMQVLHQFVPESQYQDEEEVSQTIEVTGQGLEHSPSQQSLISEVEGSDAGSSQSAR